jgi:hypothetical protein
MTVTTSLIKRQLGELPFSMQEKVSDKLIQLFGLSVEGKEYPKGIY